MWKWFKKNKKQAPKKPNTTLCSIKFFVKDDGSVKVDMGMPSIQTPETAQLMSLLLYGVNSGKFLEDIRNNMIKQSKTDGMNDFIVHIINKWMILINNERELLHGPCVKPSQVFNMR